MIGRWVAGLSGNRLLWGLTAKRMERYIARQTFKGASTYEHVGSYVRGCSPSPRCASVARVSVGARGSVGYGYFGRADVRFCSLSGGLSGEPHAAYAWSVEAVFQEGVMSYCLRGICEGPASAPSVLFDGKLVASIIAWFEAEGIQWECVGPSGTLECSSRASLTDRTAYLASLERGSASRG